MASLKYYNKNTCDVEEVWKRLNASGKFSWSWCKEKEEPFRHTAIALYFDCVPRFTINVRAVDGSSKFDAAFSEAKAIITIESLNESAGYQHFEALEEISLFTARGKQRARDRVKSILSVEPGRYNLFFNNCRDHVKCVVKQILGKDMENADFERKMAAVRSEDTAREVVVGAAAVAGLAGIALLVGSFARMFVSNESDEEEEVTA